MKILFCGNMFDDTEESLKKMKTPPPVSGHKFQENLLIGLLENNVKVKVCNIPRVRYFPNYPQIIFHKTPFAFKEKIIGRSIGFVNLFGLNYFTQEYCLRKALISYARKYKDEICVFICFNTYLPQEKAMIFAKEKCSNVRLCGVIGDLHGKYGMELEGRYKGILGRILKRIENKQDQLLKKFDSFVLLAPLMADAVGVSNKPWIVVEGMYHEKKVVDIQEHTDRSPKSKKTIFYAGAVAKEYGIQHLLNAFDTISSANYCLEIAGQGDYVNNVIEASIHDNRIHYLGLLTPEEVTEHQQEATVLVNPRLPNNKFSLYSFPSKTMECLASGKPFIAHRMPSFPMEYDNYIQYPADESDNALAEMIMKVCEMNSDLRYEIGNRGRSFILKEKNPSSQCEKILQMLNEIC